jgi:hypothetical protein
MYQVTVSMYGTLQVTLFHFNGNRVKDGKILATYDTKTVNGVSYTRINSKTSNEWIQTKYLDGSWKNN